MFWNSLKFVLLVVVLLGAVPSFGYAAVKVDGDLKIGYVIGSTTQDGGWGQSHGLAARELEKKFGAEVSITENVPEDTAKVRQVLDLYVRRGFNVIIGASYGYSDAFLEAAKANTNTDVAFLNAAGVTNAENLESFYLRTYQGWYLAGIIAGSMTEANKLSMLAGFPWGWSIGTLTDLCVGHSQ